MQRGASIRYHDFADVDAFEDLRGSVGHQSDPDPSRLNGIVFDHLHGQMVNGGARNGHAATALGVDVGAGNMPTLSEGLLVSDILIWPSWVVRSICGDTSLTRPTRSGALSRLIRAVAPGL